MAKRLKELQDQFAAAQKRMQKEGKSALEEAVKELFDEYPNLHAIRWEQYTPYFNDGESCVFGVGDARIKMKGQEETEDGGDYDDGFDDWSEWSEKYRAEQKEEPYPKGFKKAYLAVKEVFSAIPDEMMLAIFDDHVRVTATRDGFEVDEYSHD